MRLDKLLGNLKYGTRTEIKKLVKDKNVTVNGKIVTDSALHIDPNHDIITIFGEEILYKENIYLMLNKPQDYISATTDDYHKTVIDLIEDYTSYDLFPCGRLDIDTEGLLILSNDGEFGHRLTHPKRKVYKKYYVEVDDDLNNKDIDTFLSGLEVLDGNNEMYHTDKAYLEIISNRSAYVSISEGKFHQVKRMFQKVGKTVTYLKRVSIGKLMLDENLKLGEYRELSEDELILLFENDIYGG